MRWTKKWERVHLPEVDSTNNYVREMLDSFPEREFVCVQADYQSTGRGQRGNSWESERGKNLLFSIGCRPTFLEANRQFYLSQAISLSIKEELEESAKKIRIKWPNDIYWRNLKLGGILIENDLSGRNIAQCVIGVGLNLNQTTFVSDAPNPVSLLQISGQQKEPTAVLEGILRRFERYYRLIEKGEGAALSEPYHQSLLRRKGYHLFQGAEGIFGARIHHVEPDGILVLEDTEGRRRSYAFKEVSYIFENSDGGKSEEDEEE
jgi:BirA family biotin operon repressor/biotin-[acetyl-CoA-carboxylase] ligase